MRKPFVKVLSATVAISLVCGLTGCGALNSKTPTPLTPAYGDIDAEDPVIESFDAIFRGIRGYGTITNEEVKGDRFSGYLFDVDGEVLEFAIRNDEDYSVQNELQEGKEYSVTTEDGIITDVEMLTEVVAAPEPVVDGTPGERTVKNLMETALEPMGNTLYVYGGGWNWQDEGSSVQSTTLNVSPTWNEFYEENKGNYNYKYIIGTDNQEENHDGVYPFGAWNEYYYAGLDCSAYMAWILYNVTTSEEDVANGTDNSQGFVGGSSKFAKKLDEDYGFGTYTTELPDKLLPGTIVSINGHVWMAMGTCDDGSIVIIHSSATPDVNGEMSGGVQMGAIDPYASDSIEESGAQGTDIAGSCDAYKLVKKYTSQYYPEWYSYYGVVQKDYDQYVDFSENENAGVFVWDIGDDGLTDPEGYMEMSPEEILADIFENNEKNEQDEKQSVEIKYYFRKHHNLTEHFEEHGHEFPYATEEEYLAGANRVVQDPKALHKTEKEDGDDVYYLEESNEFVVVSKDGYIRTYYKPSGGKAYFDRQ